MREKRRGERPNKALSPLTYRAEEILVAKNRNFSPFVLSFVYEPDNIALRDLGTLFGTFIVTDHHEDSGYIVNCLAAAAKKEYFINSRRSVEESFESTLHKINLTLGKLVRDGHINWMGKFHGSIMAIQNRNTYFSVTGEATILLLRNNVLSAISEGLSDKEASVHPLKTFTDISEGLLMTGDKLILSTPELLELLPHALLEREASKLPLDRFAQLLKTALINERPAAATLLIDFSETPPEDTRDALRMAKKSESEEESVAHPRLVENAWSSQTFRKNDPTPVMEVESTEKKTDTSRQSENDASEHIDNRTGHIYIQADAGTPPADTETAIDRILVIIGEQISIVFMKMKKWGIKHSRTFFQWISNTAKRGVQRLMQGSRHTTNLSLRIIRGIFNEALRFGKDIFSKGTAIKNVSFSKKAVPENTSPIQYATIPKKFSFSFLAKLQYPNFSLSIPHFSFPSFPKGILNFLLKAFSFLKNLILAIQALWRESSRKKKIIFLSVATGMILVGAGITYVRSFTTTTPLEVMVVSDPTESPVTPAFPPADEPLMKEMTVREILSLNPSESPIHPVILRDQLYAITGNSIINTESKASIPLPGGATPILQASAMNDLNAIFLYGQDQKMYIYYPNAKSLVENIFPLPSGFTISDMGTYLTYL
ncbi:MAG: hypothetical protein KA034_02170, partial [Candidatus Moranbacteria bacterium]|nr:hypothetical protein [Candidatus Moranbacteria bacterium]